MWLEATVWFWGPLLGALSVWSFSRHWRTMRQLNQLDKRLAQLEAHHRDSSAQRRAA